MHKIILTSLLTFIAIVGCSNKAQRSEQLSPGIQSEPPTAEEDRRWRWDIKTLQDADADWLWVRGMPWQRHHNVTEMTKWKRPPIAKDSPRYSNRRGYNDESNVVYIEGYISAYVQEGDGDIHLVLSDRDNTMIAEVPDPDSMSNAGNRAWLRKECSTVRKWLEDSLGQPARWLPNRQLSSHPRDIGKVIIIGVPFFDKVDHGLGAASNGIEIHPVLGISIPDEN